MDRWHAWKAWASVALLLGTISFRADGSEPSDHMDLGEQALSREDWNVAAAEFSEVIRDEPTNAKAYWERGLACWRLSKLDLAITDATEAIRLDPSEPHGYRVRGAAKLGKGDFHAAIADLDEAIRIDPEHAATYSRRGYAHTRTGDLEQAIADYTEAIRIDPDNAPAYGNRGHLYSREGKREQAIADYTEAIRINPKDATAYALRSRVLWEQEARDEAIADIDQAVSLEPDSPYHHELRSLMRMDRGDIDGGMADLETAVRANPSDLATTFEAWPKHQVDDADLQHGEQQVRQMLKDRPAMNECAEKADVLSRWAARKFAGEDLGQRIFWDASEPSPWTTAQNNPSPTEPGWIRLTGEYRDGPNKDQQRSFEEMWREAVFELYNISHAKGFWRIQASADAGKLSKREFVIEFLKCEWRAAEKTRAFYIRRFLPWAREHHVPTHPQFWYVALRSYPAESLTCMTESNPSWQAYERGYDRITLRSLAMKGDYRKAVELAAELQKQTMTDKERSSIYCLTGYCLLKLEKPWSAINAFGEAIRLDPEDAATYVYRARAHLQLRDAENALADCAEAIRRKPLDAEAYRVRGYAYQVTGEHERAKADAETADAMSQLSRQDQDATGTAAESAVFGHGVGDSPQYMSPASPYETWRAETVLNPPSGSDKQGQE